MKTVGNSWCLKYNMKRWAQMEVGILISKRIRKIQLTCDKQLLVLYNLSPNQGIHDYYQFSVWITQSKDDTLFILMLINIMYPIFLYDLFQILKK